MNAWSVFFTIEAEAMLRGVEDRRIRSLLKARAMRLSSSPEMQGKPLGGELAGLRSVRAVGQRYRIVYELFYQDRAVWVITLGTRKAGARDDVYELAKGLR
jgi:mRNA interferase RelE/StbE